MKKENLHLGQLYNADEIALFWRSLPRNTQAFKNEDKIPGKKMSKEKFIAPSTTSRLRGRMWKWQLSQTRRRN